MRFDKIHAAAFSTRPGTLADQQEADPALAVSEDEKQQRRRELEQLQERIVTDINAQLQNRTVEVLVEGESKGKWRGRTYSNKLVFFNHPDDWTGRLARVNVTQTSPWSLQGQLVGEGDGN
jgi:tRNA-2-methylthio-N6-dimethylallyladenosine synthase